MKQEGARGSGPNLRIVALVAGAAVLLFAGVYFASASFQLDSYGRSADALEERLAAASTPIGVEAAAFESDPAAAEGLAAALADAASELQSVRDEARSLGAPPLAPNTGIEPHTRALAAHAESLIEYAGILVASAEFALGRAETFEEVATTLDGLQALSGEGMAVEEAERLVKGVRADFDSIVGRMHAEPPPQPVLYSNTHILWRLDDISEPLAEVENAIAARDTDRIERAFATYAEAADIDWQTQLAAHDREGKQALDAAARSVGEAAAAVGDAREPVDSLQQLLFLAAIVALVGAALSGFFALAQRNVAG